VGVINNQHNGSIPSDKAVMIAALWLNLNLLVA